MGKYFLFYQMQHQQFAYIYTQRKTMVLRTFWNQGVVIGGGGGGHKQKMVRDAHWKLHLKL